jgi:c-di-GMP-binding flagellar brake protein YcgR
MDILAERIRADSAATDFERRKYPRFSNALRIEYWQTDNLQVRLGHTTNISEDGLMASLPGRFEVGEKLGIKIFFVSSRDLISVDAIQVTASVVWANPDTENVGHHRIGMKLEEITPEGREALSHFLNHFGECY